QGAHLRLQCNGAVGSFGECVVQAAQLDCHLVALREHLLQALRGLAAACAELFDALAMTGFLALQRFQSLPDLRLLLTRTSQPTLECGQRTLGTCMRDAQLSLLVANLLPCLLAIRQRARGFLPSCTMRDQLLLQAGALRPCLLG